MRGQRRALGFLALIVLVGACTHHAPGGSPAPAPPPHVVDGGTVADGDGDTTVESPTLPIEAVTFPATSLGISAFSANARVQPHGRATSYCFEYGTTTSYGQKTAIKDVPPALTAHYRETWDNGLAAWRGGSGTDLSFVPSGGVSGGFVRYGEPTPYDYNHVDGIGVLHLVQYFYPGIVQGAEDDFGVIPPSGALGGSDPDLRDAKVHVAVRGNGWQPHGTELLWWSQVDIDHGHGTTPRYSNWAHTGFLLTDALFSGTWESVDYRLFNDTTDWTYAGTNRELNADLDRSEYFYNPLDDVLGHLDVDLFHLLAFVDPYNAPTGGIDFDDLEITYRNHSLVVPSNGGALRLSPAGSTDDPAALTDGWRNGAGHMWKSAALPQAPLEFVYDFALPVVIDRVQLHQSSEWPSKDVEVLASADGVTWTTIVQDALPQASSFGPNFAYLLAKDLATNARMLKVRILSGYNTQHWGLGEIEVFGSGAAMRTDDDWYRLNGDITGLVPGQTYHYRVAAVADGITVVGEDRTFTVPASTLPEITTGPATRIAASSAKVEGRLNTLGAEASVYFEFGTDTSYGSATEPQRQGPEITPRTFVGALVGLTSGVTYHYRLVGAGTDGTVFGADASFVAK